MLINPAFHKREQSRKHPQISETKHRTSGRDQEEQLQKVMMMMPEEKAISHRWRSAKKEKYSN